MKEDILDKYAFNQLSSEEEQWIKNMLAENPDFQQELDLHTRMVNGLIQKAQQEQETAALRAKIQQVDEALEQEGFFDKGIDKELIEGLKIEGEKDLLNTIKMVDRNLEQEGFFATSPTNKSIQFIRLFTAAASLLFILSLAWYYMASTTINYQQIYANAFHPYQNTLSKSVQMELSEQGFGGNPDEKALQEILVAMQNYDHQNYQQTIVLLQSFLQEYPTSTYQPQIEFYLGLSYIASNKNNEAIKMLQNLTNKETLDTELVEWYLALAYLKTEQIDQATSIFTKLKNQGTGIYQEKAAVILEEIS